MVYEAGTGALLGSGVGKFTHTKHICRAAAHAAHQRQPLAVKVSSREQQRVRSSSWEAEEKAQRRSTPRAARQARPRASTAAVAGSAAAAQAHSASRAAAARSRIDAIAEADLRLARACGRGRKSASLGSEAMWSLDSRGSPQRSNKHSRVIYQGCQAHGQAPQQPRAAVHVRMRARPLCHCSHCPDLSFTHLGTTTDECGGASKPPACGGGFAGALHCAAAALRLAQKQDPSVVESVKVRQRAWEGP